MILSMDTTTTTPLTLRSVSDVVVVTVSSRWSVVRTKDQVTWLSRCVAYWLKYGSVCVDFRGVSIEPGARLQLWAWLRGVPDVAVLGLPALLGIAISEILV